MAGRGSPLDVVVHICFWDDGSPQSLCRNVLVDVCLFSRYALCLVSGSLPTTNLLRGTFHNLVCE